MEERYGVSLCNPIEDGGHYRQWREVGFSEEWLYDRGVFAPHRVCPGVGLAAQDPKGVSFSVCPVCRKMVPVKDGNESIRRNGQHLAEDARANYEDTITALYPDKWLIDYHMQYADGICGACEGQIFGDDYLCDLCRSEDALLS